MQTVEVILIHESRKHRAFSGSFGQVTCELNTVEILLRNIMGLVLCSLVS